MMQGKKKDPSVGTGLLVLIIAAIARFAGTSGSCDYTSVKRLFDVGEKAHETGFLDGAGKLALIFGAGSSDGARGDFPIGTDEPSKKLGIFVIDVFDVVLLEIAGLPAGAHFAEWHCFNPF